MKNNILKNKPELIDLFIKKDDVVLDVGFWGQNVDFNNENWSHKKLLQASNKVYGLDLDYDESYIGKINNIHNYKKGNAENFSFDIKFDVIFAGDLIEHLCNPGMFLKSCRENLKENGKIIITTPNCFNLFNLVEKITKYEPTVNRDHTVYYNTRTIQTLLNKSGFTKIDYYFIYSLEDDYAQSYNKKILNFFYNVLSKFTNKYVETIATVIYE